MRLITYLSTVKTWQVYIGFINSYGIHIGIVINSNGQFSSPLQWQLWTLFLDTVNYSIFFGINSEPQYFQPPAPAQKKNTFLNTPTLKESTNLAHPKPANRSNLKRSKSNHSQMQRCFFQGEKTLKISPIFRDLKCFQHRCMARLECCSPVTQLWCLGIWSVGKNATCPTEPSARSHDLVISRL